MDQSQYYTDAPSPKCTRQCYNQRIIRGMSPEEALSPRTMKRTDRVNPDADGRDCYTCGQFFPWDSFPQKSGGIHNR